MFADVSLQFAPVASSWLIAMIAVAILVAIAVGTAGMLRHHVAPKWTAALALLRVTAWALFLMMLLQPAITSTRHAEPLPELLVLVDTSRSMAHLSGSTGTRLDEVRAILGRGDFATALRERFRPHW